jgi:hypothetical protein
VGVLREAAVKRELEEIGSKWSEILIGNEKRWREK